LSPRGAGGRQTHTTRYICVKSTCLQGCSRGTQQGTL
jgi:hypothetical protein